MNLFKKAIVMTDIHFGLKGNSLSHNQDCLQFIEWICKLAKQEQCDTLIFCGDWHHNRASLNISTMHHSLCGLETLSENFDQVLFIPGNHDLYYRDKRDIQSAEWAKHIPNVRVVNDFFCEGDVSIVPWLVGNDAQKLKTIDAKYMFGHFELPHFFMNAMIRMPDHGEIKIEDDFKGVEHVFSGHFHKRQQKDNITYLGNAFPHNYSDAWDDDRGCMILAWGEDPKFYNWPDAPKFRTANLSDLIDDPSKFLGPKTYARVNLDINISYEEANYIKETFVDEFQLRELALIPTTNDEVSQEYESEMNFESVDEIVTNHLTQIESEHFEPNLLLSIYGDL